MKQGNICIVRDGSTLLFVYRKRNPASATGDYFDSSAITAATFKVINTATGTEILGATAGSYVAALRGYRLAWTYGSALDTVSLITVEVTPTRAVGVSATLTPIDSDEFEVTDILKRQDEIEAEVDAFRLDFDAFEIVNQNEHDSTQSLVAQINGAANAILIGPPSMTVPTGGTKTYRFSFLLRDLDQSPTALVDPDLNRVTITATDQSGATPVGVTLSDSDGGTAGFQMDRDAAGEYHMDVTIDASASIDTQVTFKAAFARSGVQDTVLLSTNLVDTDPQLGRIEAQVDALRSADIPALQAAVATRESEASAAVRHVDDMAAHASTKAVADAIRSTDVPAIQSNIDAEAASIRALLQDPSYGLAALKAIAEVIRDRIGSGADAAGADTVRGQVRSALDDYLAHPAHGLAQLDAALDTITSRLGLTADVGGTTTAGTAMAKLNALLTAIDGEGELGIRARA